MTTCDVQSRGNGDSAQQHLEKQLRSLNSASRTRECDHFWASRDELFPAVSELYAATENRSGQMSVTLCERHPQGRLGGRDRVGLSLATTGGYGLAFCITADGKWRLPYYRRTKMEQLPHYSFIRQFA